MDTKSSDLDLREKIMKALNEYFSSQNKSVLNATTSGQSGGTLGTLRDSDVNIQINLKRNWPNGIESDCQRKIKKRKIEKAADGTKWEEYENDCKSNLPFCPAFKDECGLTDFAKNNIVKNFYTSAFRLIINQKIIKHIKESTILEARRQNNIDWEVTKNELYCFIAILYARGTYGARNMHPSYLWSGIWGPPFFENTMSKKKFFEILKYLRFDQNDKKVDNFEKISHIWDLFLQNSQDCYIPGTNLNVVTHVFPTKVNCSFLQPNPNKKKELGINFWLALEMKNNYLINGYPYLGDNVPVQLGENLNEIITNTLLQKYVGCGRNVTMDSSFTSIKLAKNLKDVNTTIVGSMRACRKGLPKLAKLKQDKMAKFSTKLFKHENNFLLTIYKNKLCKKEIILSSKHMGPISFGSSEERIPETQWFYSCTKFREDKIDETVRKYSVQIEESDKWQLQVFYYILDWAANNAWILYRKACNEDVTKQEFLFKLSQELSHFHAQSKIGIKQEKL